VRARPLGGASSRTRAESRERSVEPQATLMREPSSARCSGSTVAPSCASARGPTRYAAPNAASTTTVSRERSAPPARSRGVAIDQSCALRAMPTSAWVARAMLRVVEQARSIAFPARRSA
jgi:hypothetical protein